MLHVEVYQDLNEDEEKIEEDDYELEGCKTDFFMMERFRANVVEDGHFWLKVELCLGVLK